MGTRFSRQELFKPIGCDGQIRLAESTVGIIGCGALGSVIAETLVRAGIGAIHLVDRDFVEMSNIHRQQLFVEKDALNLTAKVIAAEQRLKEIRSNVHLFTYLENADGTLIEDIAEKCDILVDATDNFETRMAINDAAHKYGIPWVYGACVSASGTVFTFIPGKTACFRCLFPALPSLNETCDSVGVIAPAVQITAAHQCTEVMQWLTGHPEKLRGKVYHFDVWNHTSLEVGVSRIKKEDCPTCGHCPVYPSLEKSEEMKSMVLCGRDTIQIIPQANRRVSLEDAERLAIRQGYRFKKTPYFIQFHTEQYRMILFTNGRLLIHGLQDSTEGRKLFHQMFG